MPTTRYCIKHPIRNFRTTSARALLSLLLSSTARVPSDLKLYVGVVLKRSGDVFEHGPVLVPDLCPIRSESDRNLESDCSLPHIESNVFVFGQTAISVRKMLVWALVLVVGKTVIVVIPVGTAILVLEAIEVFGGGPLASSLIFRPAATTSAREIGDIRSRSGYPCELASPFLGFFSNISALLTP